MGSKEKNEKKPNSPEPEIKKISEEEETEEPTAQKLDEFALSSILSDKVLLFIIQKLREGPIERGALHKLLKTKFRNLEQAPHKYCDKLLQSNFIREYEYEKTKPNDDRTPNVFPTMQVGEKRTFLLLVKDFYAIRKPPVEILERLEEFNLPMNEIKTLRKEIEEFFKKYTSQKTTGDDPDVINLFQDMKIFAAISYLSNNIYQINELSNTIKQQYQGDPLKVFKTLESYNFVKTISIPDKNQQWIVLKTAVELKEIFPEYLIRSINQMAAEKKVDKDFAILTLNYLKKWYLELEKPEILAGHVQKIEELRERLKPLLKEPAAITPNDKKGIDKIFLQIIDEYKQIGDVIKIGEITKEAEETKKKYTPTT